MKYTFLKDVLGEVFRIEPKTAPKIPACTCPMAL